MTSHPYNLPPLGKRIAYPANREGVAEHFPDRAVRKSIAVDLALLERYDERITDLELDLVRRAMQHDPQAFHRLRSIPGVGKSWRSRSSTRSTRSASTASSSSRPTPGS